jgi:hypothetical protein
LTPCNTTTAVTAVTITVKTKYGVNFSKILSDEDDIDEGFIGDIGDIDDIDDIDDSDKGADGLSLYLLE